MKKSKEKSAKWFGNYLKVINDPCFLSDPENRLWIGDLVRSPKGVVAIVSCDKEDYNPKTYGKVLSIEWLGEHKGEKNSWWSNTELQLIKRGHAAEYRYKALGLKYS